MSLLFNRCGFGVAMNDDQPPQSGGVSAGDFLPGWFAEVLAERNLAVLFGGCQQDTPAVVRHAHVVELGPAARINRVSGAQIDHRFLKALRAHVAPPVEIARMPALERT